MALWQLAALITITPPAPTLTSWWDSSSNRSLSHTTPTLLGQFYLSPVLFEYHTKLTFVFIFSASISFTSNFLPCLLHLLSTPSSPPLSTSSLCLLSLLPSMHFISCSIDMPKLLKEPISKSSISALKFIVLLLQKTVAFPHDWSQFTSLYASHKSTDLKFNPHDCIITLIKICYCQIEPYYLSDYAMNDCHSSLFCSGKIVCTLRS